jgi:Ca2+-binding RTX toxin-like protein
MQNGSSPYNQLQRIKEKQIMAISGTPTNGNDVILGDQLDNSINALAGNDSIFGDLGNDFLQGLDGNDYLSGDDGNDTLWGWGGNDRIFGGEGNDSLDGYSGVAYSQEYDILTGGSGINLNDGQDLFCLGFKGYPIYYQGAGFAMITDFNGAERYDFIGDRIQLKGSDSLYKLTYEDGSSLGTSRSNSVSIKDTIIRLASNNDIIGIVEDKIIDKSVFVYV